MLKKIGISSASALFSDIPESVRLNRPLHIPGPMSEWDLCRYIQGLAGRNKPLSHLLSFLGAGCYDHHIPAAISHLLRRSEFYTAYTPYQPEVSQGTLQAIFEYQTYVARLTAMEVANASMYDGASALAEGVLMAQRLRRGRKKVLIPKSVHPEYRQVVHSIVRPLGLEFVELDVTESMEIDWDSCIEGVDEDTSCVVIQNPNFFGTIEDLESIRRLARRAHEREAIFIVLVVEPLSLAILTPPGEYGADIVVAEGQSFGIPISYGGPHLGMFATRESIMRQIPGRLVGQTLDSHGNRGFVLTLATREQHIRRERATSNICTNQSLCALATCIYLSLLGRQGLREVAGINLDRTHQALEAMEALPGFEVLQNRCFNEFVVRTPIDPGVLNERLLEKGILGGLDLSKFDPRWAGLWLLCCTEKTSEEDIQRFIRAIQEAVL
jgi:glycine dehydrogenase subunit 1